MSLMASSSFARDFVQVGALRRQKLVARPRFLVVLQGAGVDLAQPAQFPAQAGDLLRRPGDDFRVVGAGPAPSPS